MASVSLQSRLMLNCKLSGRTKFGSALTVGVVKAQCSRKSAPSGGSGKREAISTGDETMKIGMDIGAEMPPLGAASNRVSDYLRGIGQ